MAAKSSTPNAGLSEKTQSNLGRPQPTAACAELARSRCFLVSRRWNTFVFVKVHTDDGLHGVGEGTLEWQPKAVEAAINQMAERYVIGSSAFEIERLCRDMFRNEFAHGGPVTNSAIGAIEMAMWDICGKALGRPVYDLLGGRHLRSAAGLRQCLVRRGRRHRRSCPRGSAGGSEGVPGPQVGPLRRRT